MRQNCLRKSAVVLFSVYPPNTEVYVYFALENPLGTREMNKKALEIGVRQL